MIDLTDIIVEEQKINYYLEYEPLDLQGAKLNGAKLWCADLRGVDLKNIKINNKKRKIYYSSFIRKTVNLYLDQEQEKIWNNLPQNYTFSEKVEYFINYYIVNNK
ncbi:pentapeptide repeat-containing protein [Spiroplasma citri]|uniref:Hypothetical pentapeptide repeat protein n=1 Tax=Spiroplasma citri TaxID=2133 RepID=Q14MU3_SPICI|nr:pentapeptide repeat-containing protein [Spiroplasma citri]WFG97405.1 pentapeptide repeat-containing protein [Spiroplasma citri]CAK99186.1 hypothetical pentapeptide repeat protein [Spiroplasma citri]